MTTFKKIKSLDYADKLDQIQYKDGRDIVFIGKSRDRILIIVKDKFHEISIQFVHKDDQDSVVLKQRPKIIAERMYIELTNPLFCTGCPLLATESDDNKVCGETLIILKDFYMDKNNIRHPLRHIHCPLPFYKYTKINDDYELSLS